MASSVLRRPTRPDALYGLLERDLGPLARRQVLYALSYWHYVEQGDTYAGVELEDQLLEHLDLVTDPEWRLRMLAWTLPSGGGRQWQEAAVRRGHEALRLARQQGWTSEERRVSNQLFSRYQARDDHDEALRWVRRARELTVEADHVYGGVLSHADRTSLALAKGDVDVANRHGEKLLSLESEMRPTAVGRRIQDLIQVLIDRANGRWQAAYERTAARPVAHNVRGALVRRGSRYVLRQLPLAPSCSEERGRLLAWLYKRWDPPTRRVFELAIGRRYVPTRWGWMASKQPAACIDLADTLFRAGLVGARAQGWTFVESSLRARALELARPQGRPMDPAEG